MGRHGGKGEEIEAEQTHQKQKSRTHPKQKSRSSERVKDPLAVLEPPLISPLMTGARQEFVTLQFTGSPSFSSQHWSGDGL